MTKYAIYIDYDGGGYDLCYPDLIEPFGLEMEGKFIKRTGWGKIQFKNAGFLFGSAFFLKYCQMRIKAVIYMIQASTTSINEKFQC